jgi:hypothetical protein
VEHVFFCIIENIKRKKLSLSLQEIVASTCMYVFKKTHPHPWLFCSFKILDFFMGGKAFTYKEGRYHILQMEGILNIKKRNVEKVEDYDMATNCFYQPKSSTIQIFP